MPIFTESLIFIHMPKSAGTWVTETMMTYGAKRVRGGHDTAQTITAEEREGRTVFGTLRDPWGWYASWYAYSLKQGHEDRIAVWGGGSSRYEDVLRGCLAPTPERVPGSVGAVLDLHRQRDQFLASGMPWYTWAVGAWLGGSAQQVGVDLLLTVDAALPRRLGELLGREIRPEDHPRLNVSESLPDRATLWDEVNRVEAPFYHALAALANRTISVADKPRVT